MQLINPLRHISRSELTPGHLVVMDLGDAYALGIVHEVKNNGDGTLIILDGERFEDAPALYAGELSHSVMTYGVDWVLEVIPGPETFGRNSKGTSFSLILDGDRVGLRVKRGGRSGSSVLIDLQTMQTFSPSMFAAPVAHWRIWTKPADRARIGATPIIEFKPA